MKRRPPKLKSDRWVAFDSLPAAVRRALAEADYPLDPTKLVPADDVERAIRKIKRLDAAAKRRAGQPD